MTNTDSTVTSDSGTAFVFTSTLTTWSGSSHTSTSPTFSMLSGPYCPSKTRPLLSESQLARHSSGAQDLRGTISPGMRAAGFVPFPHETRVAWPKELSCPPHSIWHHVLRSQRYTRISTTTPYSRRSHSWSRFNIRCVFRFDNSYLSYIRKTTDSILVSKRNHSRLTRFPSDRVSTSCKWLYLTQMLQSTPTYHIHVYQLVDDQTPFCKMKSPYCNSAYSDIGF